MLIVSVPATGTMPITRCRSGPTVESEITDVVGGATETRDADAYATDRPLPVRRASHSGGVPADDAEANSREIGPRTTSHPLAESASSA